MNNSTLIVNWFYEQEYDHVSFDFDDYLVNAVQACLGKDPAEAELYAGGNSENLWNALRQRMDEDTARGLYPTFGEVSEGLKRLIWYPKYLPSSVSAKERWQRLRIRSRNRIIKEIQELTGIQYEALCVLACKLSGAAHYSLTPRSYDFGIDFFALIPSLGKSFLFGSGFGPMRIVGQSKSTLSQLAEKRL